MQYPCRLQGTGKKHCMKYIFHAMKKNGKKCRVNERKKAGNVHEWWVTRYRE